MKKTLPRLLVIVTVLAAGVGLIAACTVMPPESVDSTAALFAKATNPLKTPSGGATAAPTRTPTAVPTRTPTGGGTNPPTATPTRTPTGAPTATPSGATVTVSSSGGNYTVNSGSGLVIVINQSNGDMTSVKFNGKELNGSSKPSGIASGLGSATVSSKITSNTAVISCVTSSSNSVVASLTHYYIVRGGINNIYMATYTNAEPAVGELRYIFRGSLSALPNGPSRSNNAGNTGAVESTDVFGYSNGQTTSKYYGNAQAKDLTVQGATGSGVGVFTAFGTRESASGGPFFRDIENQGGGSGSDQEIYNYMNSGHNQTEAWRVGGVLHGPYAFCVTSGSTPSVPDMSFVSGLGLTGYVAASGRGTVTGTASGLDSGTTGIVGWANSTAQYWATVSGTSFTSPAMKPGTYTQTLYQGELSVATTSVSVSAGGSTSKSIASGLSHPTTVWKIGTWDGKPTEFLNGNNISLMHPQDSRNSDWGPVTYTVGSSSVGSFPAIQFRGNNSPTTIKFTLTSAQVAAHTVRIGITCAYNNGRPSVSVNGHATTDPAGSSQPSSRSFTIGTYRGNNALFTYSVPAGSFVSGSNTLTITPISGSSDLSQWLSAGWAYDCVELD